MTETAKCHKRHASWCERGRITPPTRSDKPVKFYNLNVVMSVGYRVKSIEGTRFRQWATRVLREMLLKRLEEVKRISSLERRSDAIENDAVARKQTSGSSENIPQNVPLS